jgi:ERCC4-related helicase
VCAVSTSVFESGINPTSCARERTAVGKTRVAGEAIFIQLSKQPEKAALFIVQQRNLVDQQSVALQRTLDCCTKAHAGKQRFKVCCL